MNAYGTCYDCRYGCDRCADAFTCKICTKGFFLDGDGCYPCPMGCNECGEGGKCLDKKDESSPA